MMHDPDTLASAYLDGELTDDERRAAEADPAVMAEVEQLRALWAGIAEVEPPSDSAREAAIGAAMAAFHEQFAAPASVPTEAEPDGVVVPMWQRFASPQWLGTAAAALVLVVGVGVIATRTGGDDDDSAGDETAEIVVTDEPTDDALDLPDADADRMTESEMADEAFAAEAESDDMGAADMEMAEEPAEEPADEPAEESADVAEGDDMDSSDAEMADEPASDGEDATGAAAGPPALDDPSLHFEFDVPIMGPLQLRAAGWYLLAQRADGVLGPTPEYRCEFYNVLGAALIEVDGEIREVLLEFDEADPTDRVLYAVDRDGCLVVATVELDRP